MKYQDLWNDVREDLKNVLSPDTFSNTFGEVKKVIKFDKGIIFVLVESSYNKKIINDIYYLKINELIKNNIKDDVIFKFVTEKELSNDKPIKK